MRQTDRQTETGGVGERERERERESIWPKCYCYQSSLKGGESGARTTTKETWGVLLAGFKVDKVKPLLYVLISNWV